MNELYILESEYDKGPDPYNYKRCVDHIWESLVSLFLIPSKVW
jgi:hypothetical protein